MPGFIGRIFSWTFMIGGVSFALGFFGPMLWAPGANQGPLLGILITGPLGLVAGLVVGVARELAGWRATPLEILRARGVRGAHILRASAGVVGVTLLVRGLGELPAGAERTAASAIVVGCVGLWYAAVGRIPAWFRR